MLKHYNVLETTVIRMKCAGSTEEWRSVVGRIAALFLGTGGIITHMSM